MGLTFAQYVAAPFYEGCYAPPILLKLIAYATIMALTVMNSMSVKASKYLQIITMAGKVLGMLHTLCKLHTICKLYTAVYRMFLLGLVKGNIGLDRVGGF